jgi:formylmethanofuran dehydrogenase subunit E
VICRRDLQSRSIVAIYTGSMESLEELLDIAAAAHGHLCAGQVLGVRMAMLGCRRLGVEEPHGADRKRLVTFVEIDRCATDAIGVVTGCRLGKRALKFRDWGKMAATFVDLSTGRALRIAARESSKARARELYPEMEKNQQQMRAYREMEGADLFAEEWVEVRLDPKEFPGYKGERIACDACGEGINYERYVRREGQTLCHGCAEPEARYYQPLGTARLTAIPDATDAGVTANVSGVPAAPRPTAVPRCEC